MIKITYTASAIGDDGILSIVRMIPEAFIYGFRTHQIQESSSVYDPSSHNEAGEWDLRQDYDKLLRDEPGMKICSTAYSERY